MEKRPTVGAAIIAAKAAMELGVSASNSYRKNVLAPKSVLSGSFCPPLYCISAPPCCPRPERGWGVGAQSEIMLVYVGILLI